MGLMVRLAQPKTPPIRCAAGAEYDLGTSIAGLTACDPETSDPRAVGWAFAFGQWLAPAAGHLDERNDQYRTLLDADDEVVLAWYTRHRSALLACAHVGDGPSAGGPRSCSRIDPG